MEIHEHKKEKSKSSVDRSDWVQRCEELNPSVLRLKETVLPIYRAASLGREYLTDLDNRKTQRKEDLLNPQTLHQLILQHLDFVGLKQSRQLFEQELKTKYIPHPDLNESRLVTVLRMILKDTERVFDLTMDDKFTTTGQNYKELQDHLMDLDILEEGETTEGGSDDVNIWEENPYNIIYEKDMKSIKGCSLNNLIVRLTEAKDEDYDPQLLSIVLHTYRTFTTPEKFLEKLEERFNVPAKDPSGVVKDEDWREMKKTIQLRVVNVLKKWIMEHYSDFRNSDKLMKRLEEFIARLEEVNPFYSRPLNAVIANKERALESDRSIIRDFGRPPPDPKVSFKNIFSPTLDVMDCDEEEIARQLTLVEFEMYSAIQPSELLNLAWSKPKLKHRAPNVLRLIDRSTKVSQWAATLVLTEDRIRKRVRTMAKLIKIAEYCFGLNNFSTSMAIIAGLSVSAVHRLRFTFSEMPRNSQSVFFDLQQKLSSDHAYKVYRAILARADPPCIPYLGTFLTDLTFIEENNPQYKGLINFFKRRLIYDVIEKIQRYQHKAYNLIPVNQIQVLLETKRFHCVADEDERFRMSVVLEPRGAQRSEIL